MEVEDAELWQLGCTKPEALLGIAWSPLPGHQFVPVSQQPNAEGFFLLPGRGCQQLGHRPLFLEKRENQLKNVIFNVLLKQNTPVVFLMASSTHASRKW